MKANETEFVVAGEFDDERAAGDAASMLRAAGVRDEDVEVVSAALAAGAVGGRGEVRFVARLVWVVVWWSILGGAVGALLGAGIVWAGVGGGKAEDAFSGGVPHADHAIAIGEDQCVRRVLDEERNVCWCSVGAQGKRSFRRLERCAASPT